MFGYEAGAMKLTSEKTKDGFTEMAAEKVCKMMCAAGRQAAVACRVGLFNEVLAPAQAKEFLQVGWHVRWALSVTVEAVEGIDANAKAAADDAW
jgi:hypothetical protein